MGHTLGETAGEGPGGHRDNGPAPDDELMPETVLVLGPETRGFLTGKGTTAPGGCLAQPAYGTNQPPFSSPGSPPPPSGDELIPVTVFPSPSLQT